MDAVVLACYSDLFESGSFYLREENA